MADRKKGVCLAVLTLALFAPDATLMKLIGHTVTPQDTVDAMLKVIAWKLPMLGTINLVVGAIAEGGVQPLLRGWASGSRHVILAAIFQCSTQICFTTMYLLTDAATALLLMSLNPLWTALLSWLCFNEPLPRRTIAALAGAAISLSVVFVPQLAIPAPTADAAALHLWPHALLGDLIAIGAGVSVAGYLTVVRHAASHCPRANMSASAGIGSFAAGLLGFASAAALGTSMLEGVAPAFWPLAFLDASTVAAAYFFKASALRYLPATNVALLILLQVGTGPLLVFVVLHEAPQLWTLVGGSCLLAVLAAHELAAKDDGTEAFRHQVRRLGRAASPNVRGAVTCTLGTAAFVVNDALVKLVMANASEPLAVATRNSLALPFILALCLFQRDLPRLLRTSRFDACIIVGRVLGDCGTAFCFLVSLQYLPLATAATIMMSCPLGVTAGGAVFFGEHVGWRRWLVLLLGFFGVLVVLRPTPTDLNPWALVTVVAALLTIFRDLLTKKMSHTVPSSAVVLLSTAFIGIFHATLALARSDALDTLQAPRDYLLLAGASVLISLAVLSNVLMMRVGETSVVQPFRYTLLLWAAVLQLLLFGTWPDVWTCVGGAIVCACGVMSLRMAQEQETPSGSMRAACTTSTTSEKPTVALADHHHRSCSAARSDDPVHVSESAP